jgi:hypothetical protein
MGEGDLGHGDEGQAYVWPVIRILVGILAGAGGVFLMAREDWIHGDDEATRYAVLIAVGTLLWVWGVLGVVRARRDAKRQSPPWTLQRKLVWLAASVLLALPVAAGIAFAARALNVLRAEEHQWRTAESAGTAEAYDHYASFAVHFHPALAEPRIEEAERARADAALAGAHGANDDAYADAVLRWRNRYRTPHERIHDPLTRMMATDAGWLLDTFTPIRTHLPAADQAYAEACFQEARTAGTVRALRLYRQEHTNGAHREETAEALRALYREAEARYAAIVATGGGAAGAGLRSPRPTPAPARS